MKLTSMCLDLPALDVSRQEAATIVAFVSISLSDFVSHFRSRRSPFDRALRRRSWHFCLALRHFGYRSFFCALTPSSHHHIFFCDLLASPTNNGRACSTVILSERNDSRGINVPVDILCSVRVFWTNLWLSNAIKIRAEASLANDLTNRCFVATVGLANLLSVLHVRPV